MVRRAVQPVAQAPTPFSDRELSRRSSELTDKKTTLEAKLEKHKGQVQKGQGTAPGERRKDRRPGAGSGGGYGVGGRGQGSIGWTQSDRGGRYG